MLKKLKCALLGFLLVSSLCFAGDQKTPVKHSAKLNDSPYIIMASKWGYGDHDPGTSEVPNSGTFEQYDNVVNVSTGTIWLLVDATENAQVWIPLGVIPSKDALKAHKKHVHKHKKHMQLCK